MLVFRSKEQDQKKKGRNEGKVPEKRGKDQEGHHEEHEGREG
jgi:hypothetical protein